MSHSKLEKLSDDTYEVVIDADLMPGSLTYGELYLPGKKSDEVFFSTYVCHPSLCNDNLSGVALSAMLARNLIKLNLNYSYRFVFVPETIGALTWLNQNENLIENIKHGMVVTCVGDKGSFTYKKSRQGNAQIDRVVQKVLRDTGQDFKVLDYFPRGSDERQYSSPGFNLPVGLLMKSIPGEYEEYHTSADNLDFISAGSLSDSLARYLDVVHVLEHDGKFINLSPKGEPQLGRRGLYGEDSIEKSAICWILNMCDGQHSLLDIAVQSKLPFSEVVRAADKLIEHGLLGLP